MSSAYIKEIKARLASGKVIDIDLIAVFGERQDIERLIVFANDATLDNPQVSLSNPGMMDSRVYKQMKVSNDGNGNPQFYYVDIENVADGSNNKKFNVNDNLALVLQQNNFNGVTQETQTFTIKGRPTLNDVDGFDVEWNNLDDQLLITAKNKITTNHLYGHDDDKVHVQLHYALHDAEHKPLVEDVIRIPYSDFFNKQTVNVPVTVPNVPAVQPLYAELALQTSLNISDTINGQPSQTNHIDDTKIHQQILEEISNEYALAPEHVVLLSEEILNDFTWGDQTLQQNLKNKLQQNMLLLVVSVLKDQVTKEYPRKLMVDTVDVNNTEASMEVDIVQNAPPDGNGLVYIALDKKEYKSITVTPCLDQIVNLVNKSAEAVLLANYMYPTSLEITGSYYRATNKVTVTSFFDKLSEKLSDEFTIDKYNVESELNNNNLQASTFKYIDLENDDETKETEFSLLNEFDNDSPDTNIKQKLNLEFSLDITLATNINVSSGISMTMASAKVDAVGNEYQPTVDIDQIRDIDGLEQIKVVAKESTDKTNSNLVIEKAYLSVQHKPNGGSYTTFKNFELSLDQTDYKATIKMIDFSYGELDYTDIKTYARFIYKHVDSNGNVLYSDDRDGISVYANRLQTTGVPRYLEYGNFKAVVPYGIEFDSGANSGSGAHNLYLKDNVDYANYELEFKVETDEDDGNTSIVTNIYKQKTNTVVVPATADRLNIRMLSTNNNIPDGPELTYKLSDVLEAAPLELVSADVGLTTDPNNNDQTLNSIKLKLNNTSNHLAYVPHEVNVNYLISHVDPTKNQNNPISGNIVLNITNGGAVADTGLSELVVDKANLGGLKDLKLELGDTLDLAFKLKYTSYDNNGREILQLVNVNNTVTETITNVLQSTGTMILEDPTNNVPAKVTVQIDMNGIALNSATLFVFHKTPHHMWNGVQFYEPGFDTVTIINNENTTDYRNYTIEYQVPSGVTSYEASLVITEAGNVKHIVGSSPPAATINLVN